LNKEDWLVVTETCDMLLQMRANMVLSQSAAIQSSVSGQGLASFLEPYSASVLLRLTTFLRVDLVNTSKWMLCQKANVDLSKWCKQSGRFSDAGYECWNHACLPTSS
jgi:hypothetical protein